MKAKMKVLIVMGAAILTFIANAAAASACWTFMYQPEVPKALREE